MEYLKNLWDALPILSTRWEPLPVHGLESPNSRWSNSHRTMPFSPTYVDVCAARAMLRSLRLPTELVLAILDEAHYWPSQQFTTNSQAMVASATMDPSSSAKLCLDASVLNSHILQCLGSEQNENVKIKAIRFALKSHDQGWTSENTQGTFSTSSWLEVSILRRSSEIAIHHRRPASNLKHPGEYQQRLQNQGLTLVARPLHAKRGPQDDEGDYAWWLQGNRVAHGNFENYRVVWGGGCPEGNEGAGHGEAFLEELRAGDRVLVWARAKYPGWKCVVESVQIRVYYGF